MTSTTIPAEVRADVEILWDFHQMHHELEPADIGIGLGSHDPGVAVEATNLFHAGMYPLLVFTGANSPTTVDRFPRGEAVHYREYALGHGVPDDKILIETASRSTAENVTLTRELLAENGVEPKSVIVISRPYQQRRAYGTFRKLWQEVDVRCASLSLPLDEYVQMIGDVNRVVNMMVGDTQRLALDAVTGIGTSQHLPGNVKDAFDRLVEAGFRSRII